VEAAVAELGLAEEWYGKFNRESQTVPVLDLRESAMRLGLQARHAAEETHLALRRLGALVYPERTEPPLPPHHSTRSHCQRNSVDP
jgi:hypothetical protein